MPSVSQAQARFVQHKADEAAKGDRSAAWATEWAAADATRGTSHLPARAKKGNKASYLKAAFKPKAGVR